MNKTDLVSFLQLASPQTVMALLDDYIEYLDDVDEADSRRALVLLDAIKALWIKTWNDEEQRAFLSALGNRTYYQQLIINHMLAEDDLAPDIQDKRYITPLEIELLAEWFASFRQKESSHAAEVFRRADGYIEVLIIPFGQKEDEDLTGAISIAQSGAILAGEAGDG